MGKEKADCLPIHIPRIYLSPRVDHICISDAKPNTLSSIYLIDKHTYLYPLYVRLLLSSNGAGSGTWTHTMFPSTDFKSVMSANSIIPAY